MHPSTIDISVRVSDVSGLISAIRCSTRLTGK
jgi:hypothetical protein